MKKKIGNTMARRIDRGKGDTLGKYLSFGRKS